MNEKLQLVLDYWLAKCDPLPDGQFPTLQDIDLMDLHQIAANLLLADVVPMPDGTRRYRWRYWGTRLAEYFGYEMTGQYIDEAYSPDAYEKIAGSYEWTVEARKIHYWKRRGGLVSDDQKYLTYERLICPISGPNGEIAHLFGAITSLALPKWDDFVTRDNVMGRLTISPADEEN